MMKDWSRILLAGAAFVGVTVLLAGCAGPSKARYKQLLGECRKANREHVRMLKAAEKTCPTLPEQEAGAVEIGLGGF